MRILKWCLLPLLVLSVSCSHMQNEKVGAVKKSDFGSMAEWQIKKSDLESMVEEAKRVGGKAKDFLASDLFLKGNDASVRGDFQAAAYLFQLVNQLVPEEIYIKKKLAFELVRLGDLKGAEKHLEHAFNQLGKQDEMVGFVLGNLYSSLEKPKEAKQVYQKLLSQNPFSEEACLYLAKMYVAEKLYKDVQKLLSECQKRNPESAAYSFFLGKVEYEKNHKDKALEYFHKSLEIDPTYAQAALASGAIYEERESNDNALKIYKQFLKTEENRENAQILSKIVQLLFLMEKDEEVVSYAETLMSIDSSDLNLKVRLGLIYSDLGRYEDAEKLFKDVLISVPDSDKVLYYLGALNQQIKRIPESLAYYQQIPNSSPLFGDASLQMAQLLSSKGREDFVLGKLEASKIFIGFIDHRLKENDESVLELKMLLTSFYEDTFQYKEAIETLSSVKNHKNFTESHSYYLAALLEKNGEYKEARMLVQKIIDKDPNNAHALNFLGYSYLEKNEKLDQAFEYISKAVSLRPDDGYIRDSLAWYFYQTGRYREALVQAKKATGLVKNDSTITKHLGMIYQRLRYFDKAKIYLTEALKHSKVDAEREDVLKILRDIEEIRAPASKP